MLDLSPHKLIQIFYTSPPFNENKLCLLVIKKAENVCEYKLCYHTRLLSSLIFYLDICLVVFKYRVSIVFSLVLQVLVSSWHAVLSGMPMHVNRMLSMVLKGHLCTFLRTEPTKITFLSFTKHSKFVQKRTYLLM